MAVTGDDIVNAINAVHSLDELEAVRVDLLGRKGSLTEQLKRLGSMAPEKRAEAGQAANALKVIAEEALREKREVLLHEQTAEMAHDGYDLTVPGTRFQLGHHHPVSVVMDELIDLFWQMGYQVANGPEIDTEWYNFEALLVGRDHPARDMQDTFYLETANLPRTHTSAVQIRFMEQHKDDLPIRIVAPGKVYRNEDEDARHSWQFYQLEGLVVDTDISVADLKGTLTYMLKGILGEETKTRLRPNYFPYTEPSVEMDASCVICHGVGRIGNGEQCKLCSGTGWLELGGAGMVHPRVLRNVGIDPGTYSGFAFGFGPERLATIKYGVNDVREFWRPSFEFLSQF